MSKILEICAAMKKVIKLCPTSISEQETIHFLGNMVDLLEEDVKRDRKVIELQNKLDKIENEIGNFVDSVEGLSSEDPYFRAYLTCRHIMDHLKD